MGAIEIIRSLLRLAEEAFKLHQAGVPKAEILARMSRPGSVLSDLIDEMEKASARGRKLLGRDPR